MRTPGFLPRAQVAIGIGYLALFVGFSLWARFDVPYRDDWDWMLSALTGPGPWVREPAPSPAQVHAAVMRELRGPRSSATGERPWIGFAQAGSGGPYQWVGSDSTGAPVCVAALTLAASVHATLDRVDVGPGNVLQVAGWAFACADACVPDAPAGVHLQARPGPLSPGPHTATLRVVSASGAIGEPGPVTFVVPAGAAQ